MVNESENEQTPETEVGLITLAVVKPGMKLTHAVRGLTPWEVRAALQEMLEISERTIIHLQAERLALASQAAPAEAPAGRGGRLFEKLQAKGAGDDGRR